MILVACYLQYIWRKVSGLHIADCILWAANIIVSIAFIDCRRRYHLGLLDSLLLALSIQSIQSLFNSYQLNEY
jgi:hypothetical protein